VAVAAGLLVHTKSPVVSPCFELLELPPAVVLLELPPAVALLELPAVALLELPLAVVLLELTPAVALLELPLAVVPAELLDVAPSELLIKAEDEESSRSLGTFVEQEATRSNNNASKKKNFFIFISRQFSELNFLA